MQVQQRQHRLDLRGLARPRRQDRRREPLPLTGFRVDPLVVDPRRVHRHRARAGGHRTRLVVAVAHHQPPPVLVAVVGEPGAVGIHFGLQRLGQHPPRALPDKVVDQRRPRRRSSRRTIAAGRIRNYSEHGSYLPDQRYRAGLAWNLHSVTREGTPLPEPIHRFQPLPAPRGARSYLPPSGEGLEVNLWVRWLTRSRKVNGDKSMPGNRRSCPGVRGEALGGPA